MFSWLAVLDEANHVGLFAEASPALVEAVLPDQSVGVVADPACPGVLAEVPRVSEVNFRHINNNLLYI